MKLNILMSFFSILAHHIKVHLILFSLKNIIFFNRRRKTTAWASHLYQYMTPWHVENTPWTIKLAFIGICLTNAKKDNI